jgi:hypothetical protein
MKRFLWCFSLLLVGSLCLPAQAETDLMEAAAPPAWYFQNWQIYYHGNGFARDKVPLSDLDVDAYTTLFRLARWWEGGVVHVIVPLSYTDLEADVRTPAGSTKLFGGHECGMGDVYVGGGKRWINESKDCFFLLGADLRTPTGDYHSDEDATSPSFIPFRDTFNVGSGSLSVQPFGILTKLFDGGKIASDTEVRYDINTEAGPINYNPNDRLEIWQNLSYGFTKEFRLGGAFKGEFTTANTNPTHDYADSMAVGPAALYATKDFQIWAKVLFNVWANDASESGVLVYLRLSFPF